MPILLNMVFLKVTLSGKNIAASLRMRFGQPSIKIPPVKSVLATISNFSPPMNTHISVGNS